MITVLEMGAARHFLRTQQLARTAEERAQILQPTLEINAGCVCVWTNCTGWRVGESGFLSSSDCALLSHRHDLIKKLFALKDTNSELAGLLLEQVLCSVISSLFALCPFFPLMISKTKKTKNAISQFLTLSLYLEEQK